MRTCKTCKTKFKPIYSSVQMCCSPKCAIEYDKKLQVKKWKKEKKAIKESLKTVQELVQEVQKVFNSYIRLRDKGLPCISCGNPNMKKVNASR